MTDRFAMTLRDLWVAAVVVSVTVMLTLITVLAILGIDCLWGTP